MAGPWKLIDSRLASIPVYLLPSEAVSTARSKLPPLTPKPTALSVSIVSVLSAVFRVAPVPANRSTLVKVKLSRSPLRVSAGSESSSGSSTLSTLSLVSEKPAAT